MNIHDIAKLYAMLPQVGALRHVLENKSKGDVFLQGLVGSAVPMAFAALAQSKKGKKTSRQDKTATRSPRYEPGKGGQKGIEKEKVTKAQLCHQPARKSHGRQ